MSYPTMTYELAMAAAKCGGIVVGGAVYGPFRVRLPLSDGTF